MLSTRQPTTKPANRATAKFEKPLANDDGELLHHVHSDDPRFPFDIGEQPAGVPKSVRFTARGVFEVRCGIHPRMLLQVTVR